MSEAKNVLLQYVESVADEVFALGCDLFDHPEYGRTEVYASDRLTKYLEEKGFTVERGLADLPTSFRAVWERGSGVTLACGTGSCAVLVAANVCGLADRRAAVVLDGGELNNEWDEATGHVFMTGPATFVFDGEVDAD